MPTKAQSHTSTDHEEIQRWAEARGAKPACVKGTGDTNDIGILRLEFPGYTGEDKLQPISWDEWFEKFDERNLALLYQEETAGGEESNFNKIVSRETADEVEEKSHRATPHKKSVGPKSSAKKSSSKRSTAKKSAKR
jgi:hypothetical protein